MKIKNLFYRLSIYFLFTAIIFSGIFILVGFSNVRNLIYESNQYRLQFEVREILDDVENSMDNASRFTEHLAMDIKQQNIQNNFQKYMGLVFNGQPNTYAMGIVLSNTDKSIKSEFTLFRSHGNIILNTKRFITSDLLTNSWIEKMFVSEKAEWSTPYFDSQIGSRAVIFAYPFEFQDNGLVIHAVFFCAVELNTHLQKLNNQAMIKAGYAVVLNDKNKIVYDPDQAHTGNDIGSVIKYLKNSKLDIIQLLANHQSGNRLVRLENKDFDSTVIVYWPINSSNWFTIIAIPEEFFISDLVRQLLFLIPLLLFIGSVAAAIIIYFSMKLVSPITILANDTRKIIESAEFEREINTNDPKLLSDSKLIWQLTKKHTDVRKNDINSLTSNMEMIKDRLAIYSESSIKSSSYTKEIEKELTLARDIEMGMVPTNFPLFPDRTDFDCFGKLIPAKIVGGDLFDLFLLNENQLFISITDTVGKGIPAAMFSVMTRTFIRSIANDNSRLGMMMESLNEALTLVHDSEMFATVFIAKLDLKSGELVYCNAGHPYPLILRNNSIEESLIHAHGIPVGVKRQINYSESRIRLLPGESLITFTDGVTEQMNNNGDFFGLEGLVKAIKLVSDSSAEKIVNTAFLAVDHFRGNTEIHDDRTLVAIKFIGQNSNR